MILIIFFFNDTATTEIYTLSLHDALPISGSEDHEEGNYGRTGIHDQLPGIGPAEDRSSDSPDEYDSNGDDEGGGLAGKTNRSEEHTSELQSRQYLVCRLLLEKKKLL